MTTFIQFERGIWKVATFTVDKIFMKINVSHILHAEYFTKVGIRNWSPHLHNIADNQIDCGVAD